VNLSQQYFSYRWDEKVSEGEQGCWLCQHGILSQPHLSYRWDEKASEGSRVGGYVNMGSSANYTSATDRMERQVRGADLVALSTCDAQSATPQLQTG